MEGGFGLLKKVTFGYSLGAETFRWVNIINIAWLFWDWFLESGFCFLGKTLGVHRSNFAPAGRIGNPLYIYIYFIWIILKTSHFVWSWTALENGTFVLMFWQKVSSSGLLGDPSKMSFVEKSGSLSTKLYIPDAPCMEYLPTFGLNLW